MSAALDLMKSNPSETYRWEGLNTPANDNQYLYLDGNLKRVKSTINDQAGFTGHIKDSATGLNYMQARYYDPLIGRFLSSNPIEFSSQRPEMFGSYTYVGNDPINLIDPEGESARAAAKTALAGIATDVAIPEPSDALPHKWVGYAILGTVAGITLAVTNESHSKGKTDVAPITGAKTNTDSKREDSFVVRLQAHTSLIDEPYMAMKYMDLAERVIEYRMDNRAVIVDLYNEPVLDSFFGNIGADDSIRV